MFVCLVVSAMACGRTGFDPRALTVTAPGPSGPIGSGGPGGLGGDGDPTDPSVITVDAHALSHMVIVQWSSASGDVYWSSDPACVIADIESCANGGAARGVQSPYVINGLTNGVGYYVAVVDGDTAGVGEAHPARIGFDADVREITVSSGIAYVGGDFEHAGPVVGSGMPIWGVVGRARARFPVISGRVNVAIADGGTGWFIGGTAMLVDGEDRGSLLHVSGDGVLDTAYPFVAGAVEALVLVDGTLYVGGDLVEVGGVPRTALAAIDGAEQVSTSLPDADAPISAIAAANGVLYVGGAFTSLGGNARERLASIAVADESIASWGPAADGSVRSIAVADGVVYVGGTFTTIGGAARTNAAAIATDGTVLAWNPSPNGQVNAIAIAEATIYLGGAFTQMTSGARGGLAAVGTSGALLPWSPTVSGSVRTVVPTNGVVYCGGQFGAVNGIARGSAAAVDANGALTGWNPSANGDVNVLALGVGAAYIGGSFTMLGTIERTRLAALDAQGALTAWAPAANGRVNAITVDGEAIYLGGSFTEVNGESRARFAAVRGVDGDTLPIRADVDGDVLSITAFAGTLVLGGDFTSVGGVARPRLAQIDTNGVLTAANLAPNGTVYGAIVVGNGLYVGGAFTTIGGSSRSRIARLNTPSLALNTYESNADGAVYAIALDPGIDGARFYAGGTFTRIFSNNHRGIAQLGDAGQSNWRYSFDAPPRDIVVSQSGEVYVVGEFITVSGLTRTHAVVIPPTSGQPRAWNPQLDDTMYAIALNGGNVLAGGASLHSGRSMVAHFAIIGADGNVLP